MSVKIRSANKNDITSLTSIGYKTFYDTFAQHNTQENMLLYLMQSFNIEKQTLEINEPQTIFLLAEIEDSVVGYVKLKGNNSCDGIKGTKPIELERIYTLQEYIGKGIGAELMNASIKEAKERGFDSIWLGVWENNERAIRFYEKLGFSVVGSHIFMLGNDKQNDFIMELALK